MKIQKWDRYFCRYLSIKNHVLFNLPNLPIPKSLEILYSELSAHYGGYRFVKAEITRGFYSLNY